ncbi:phytanoyl-CoA dioxygenase family protein [Flavobacterium daejeonense]|uniref:phytanoyl-CoA dioxygenase family protein n=1 Tax=Flavobacterium daejeonense TaxID=350893 RepID=UPI00047A17D4|nr:phytanoyl-CoA dioxygenase family protein [Flavobacterium daejeonense]
MKLDLLENFWNRILSTNSKTEEQSDWNTETGYLYQLGISMEETLQYLYQEKPSLLIFIDWVESKKKEVLKSIHIENVLSEKDLAFWESNGYVVIKNAIPIEDCIATQKAILDFLKKDINDSSSWYKHHEKQSGLMVNFYNHPTLEKNRASIKIQKAYEQLYKTTKIYKTIDKVSFNPPVTNEYNFLGSNLHWDVSLKQPIPFRLQGLLYLSDCNENEGAFNCVPNFHNQIANWMSTIPSNENPREFALKTLVSKPIIGNAGDFIIWHQALPHCATPNYGKTPRFVQYLTYFPENYTESTEWI